MLSTWVIVRQSAPTSVSFLMATTTASDATTNVLSSRPLPRKPGTRSARSGEPSRQCRSRRGIARRAPGCAPSKRAVTVPPLWRLTASAVIEPFSSPLTSTTPSVGCGRSFLGSRGWPAPGVSSCVEVVVVLDGSAAGLMGSGALSSSPSRPQPAASRGRQSSAARRVLRRAFIRRPRSCSWCRCWSSPWSWPSSWVSWTWSSRPEARR